MPDEEDRLLEVPAATNEPGLLAGVLGVVARIGLVRDQVTERRAQHGQIGVDRHTTAKTAEVVVEARPRLVGHELPVDALTVGQPEESSRALAKVLGQRMKRGVQLLDRHGLGLTPRDVPLGERTTTGHDLVEPSVRGRELRFVDERRAHAVAALDLVDVLDRLAGQLLGRRLQADQLGPQPTAPVGVELGLASATVELGDQRGRASATPAAAGRTGCRSTVACNSAGP